MIYKYYLTNKNLRGVEKSDLVSVGFDGNEIKEINFKTVRDCTTCSTYDDTDDKRALTTFNDYTILIKR